MKMREVLLDQTGWGCCQRQRPMMNRLEHIISYMLETRQLTEGRTGRKFPRPSVCKPFGTAIRGTAGSREKSCRLAGDGNTFKNRSLWENIIAVCGRWVKHSQSVSGLSCKRRKTNKVNLKSKAEKGIACRLRRIWAFVAMENRR